MKSFSLCAAVLVLIAFSAQAQTNPPESQQEMGTISCPGKTFDCDNPFTDRDKVLNAANECIKTIFGIKESILDGFGSGDKENCAIARNPTYEDGGTKIWAVCCLKPIKERKDCKLRCTRFISTENQHAPGPVSMPAPVPVPVAPAPAAVPTPASPPPP
jgi:hypothetical protein